MGYVGLNWRAMKERHTKAQEDRARRGRVAYLQDGRNIVRLLPIPKRLGENALPFAEAGKHFKLNLLGLSENVMFCPRLTRGKECPICNYVETLYASPNEEDKKLARDLSAGKTYFFPVVLRGKEALGPKLLEVNTSVWEDIIDKFNLEEDEAERLDLTHPKEGRDIIITKEPKTQYGASYKVKLRNNATPIGNKAQLEEWLKAYPDPEEFIDSQLRTADQIQALLKEEDEVAESAADVDPEDLDDNLDDLEPDEDLDDVEEDDVEEIDEDEDLDDVEEIEDDEDLDEADEDEDLDDVEEIEDDEDVEELPDDEDLPDEEDEEPEPPPKKKATKTSTKSTPKAAAKATPKTGGGSSGAKLSAEQISKQIAARMKAKAGK